MGNEKEMAIIPKGAKIQIMGCSYTLLEDTSVEGSQTNLDYILKEQENFDKGIGIVSEMPKSTMDNLAAGALSAMHVSENVGSSEPNMPKNWRL